MQDACALYKAIFVFQYGETRSGFLDLSVIHVWVSSSKNSHNCSQWWSTNKQKIKTPKRLSVFSPLLSLSPHKYKINPWCFTIYFVSYFLGYVHSHGGVHFEISICFSPQANTLSLLCDCVCVLDECWSNRKKSPCCLFLSRAFNLSYYELIKWK